MAAYIYHFYEDVAGDDPLLNRRQPILLSIASLRRYRPDDHVYVVDTGLVPQKWDKYRRELGFEVVPPWADPIPVGYPLADGRSMERLWTLTDHPGITEDVVVSVSNNLIFLEDPEPLDEGSLDAVLGGESEGLVVYRRSSERATWMMRVWQGLCLSSLQPGRFQRSIRDFYRGLPIDEHAVLDYALAREKPDGWDNLPHGAARPFFHLADLGGTEGLKSVCLTEGFVGFDKVQIVLAFKELHEAVSRVSWIDRLGGVEPSFVLEDLATHLEEIREHFGFESEKFFRRHDGDLLWVPTSHSIRLSGRSS